MMLYSREPKWKTPVVILVMLCLVEKCLNIWFRLNSLKTADDSSSLSLTLQHPPFFFLIQYHMENFSSPQSKARKKYSSGFFNSSSGD